MKNSLLAILGLVAFSTCNKTRINNCCTGTPQIVYVDSSYIAMPDIFTPNADGINDQLFVIYKNIVSSKLTIRKGTGEVFSSTSITNSWDGGSEREKVYSYTLEAITTSGNVLSLSGDIAVIRDNCAKGNFEECHFATQFNFFSNSFDKSLPSLENIKVCN